MQGECDRLNNCSASIQYTTLPLRRQYGSLNHNVWVWSHDLLWWVDVSGELCLHDLAEHFGPIIHQEQDMPRAAASSRKMWRNGGET